MPREADVKKAEKLVKEFAAFDKECEENQETDLDILWELANEMRDMLINLTKKR